MGNYLLGLIIGALLVPGLYLAGLAFLDRGGRLPPPQFSNSICIDEKLAAMRRSPPQTPNFLVVGSSVAWRHFNSPVAIEAQPRLIPYNAGFCGANIRQTRAIVDWLTGRLPSVTDVLLIVSPVDFEACEGEPTVGLFPSRFDVTEADRYVFEDSFSLPYYLGYFDPLTLWRNSKDIATRRTDMTNYASLLVNDFGDGPIEPDADRGLLYNAPKIDGTCFSEMRQMALNLQRQSIGFNVAVTPLHPEWLRLYDKEGEVSRMLDWGIDAALTDTGGHFLTTKPGFADTAFFDAIHLRWSQTADLTRSLVSQVSGKANQSVPHPRSSVIKDTDG